MAVNLNWQKGNQGLNNKLTQVQSCPHDQTSDLHWPEMKKKKKKGGGEGGGGEHLFPQIALIVSDSKHITMAS